MKRPISTQPSHQVPTARQAQKCIPSKLHQQGSSARVTIFFGVTPEPLTRIDSWGKPYPNPCLPGTLTLTLPLNPNPCLPGTLTLTLPLNPNPCLPVLQAAIAQVAIAPPAPSVDLNRCKLRDAGGWQCAYFGVVQALWRLLTPTLVLSRHCGVF